MNALIAGGCSAANAARELPKLWPALASCSERGLRNSHSQLGDIAKLIQEGYFIAAATLRPWVWGSQPRTWVKYVAT